MEASEEKVTLMIRTLPIMKTEDGRYLHQFQAARPIGTVNGQMKYAGIGFQFTTSTGATNSEEYKKQYETYHTRAYDAIELAIKEAKNGKVQMGG